LSAKRKPKERGQNRQKNTRHRETNQIHAKEVPFAYSAYSAVLSFPYWLLNSCGSPLTNPSLCANPYQSMRKWATNVRRGRHGSPSAAAQAASARRGARTLPLRRAPARVSFSVSSALLSVNFTHFRGDFPISVSICANLWPNPVSVAAGRAAASCSSCFRPAANPLLTLAARSSCASRLQPPGGGRRTLPIMVDKVN
jgi:hypothetical protein